MSSADLVKMSFSKKCFRNTIRVSNGLDPDQDRHSVGPDLGPNCFQRLSADDKICRYRVKSELTSEIFCSMKPPSCLFTLDNGLGNCLLKTCGIRHSLRFLLDVTVFGESWEKVYSTGQLPNTSFWNGKNMNMRESRKFCQRGSNLDNFLFSLLRE